MADEPLMAKAERFDAMKTSPDEAGHVMTHMGQPSKAGNMTNAAIHVPMQGRVLWPAKLPSQARSTKHVVLEHGAHRLIRQQT